MKALLLLLVSTAAAAAPSRLDTVQSRGTPDGDVDHRAFFDAGDINGDGFPDVGAWVTCAPVDWPQLEPDRRRCTNGRARLYVWYGTRDGIADKPATAFDRAFTEPSTFAAAVGDFDGDGFADILWGNAIYRGGKRGLGAAPFITLHASNDKPLDVSEITRTGDFFDGDGISDLELVGHAGDFKMRRYTYRGGRSPSAAPARDVPRR